MQIYLGRGGKQAGPYTQDELNQMLRDEQVELTDLFWSQGMPEWRPLSEVTGGSHYWDGINRTLAPSMPSESGALLEDRPVEVKDLSPFDNSEPVKADAPAQSDTAPKVSSSLKTESTEAKLAAPIKRILAYLINQILLLLCLLPLVPFADMQKLEALTNNTDMTQAMQLSEQFVQSIPPWAAGASLLLIAVLVVIQTVLLLRTGQSIGKKLVGVQIVEADSLKVPGFGKLIGLRTVLTMIVYSIPAPIGLTAAFVDATLMVFRADRKSGHDLVAGTRVIDKPKKVTKSV